MFYFTFFSNTDKVTSAEYIVLNWLCRCTVLQLQPGVGQHPEAGHGTRSESQAQQDDVVAWSSVPMPYRSA